MRYWITHPKLTPEHDHEIDAGALVDWARSGWQIRADQTPPPDDFTPADPRPPVDDDAPPAAAVDGQTQDDNVAPEPKHRPRKGA